MQVRVCVCGCFPLWQRGQQPVLQSKSARVSGWRRPPSVAESGEGVHLDGVLEGRPQPAVGQAHSHLQVHLQWRRRIQRTVANRV